jgi:large subunit ribosomal protein L29
MKPEEIRNLSAAEREEKARDIAEEYFNLKFQLATGKIENPGRLRMLRRNIARIKSIQTEIAAGKGKKVKA